MGEMHMIDFSDKSVIVSGGSRGIGAAAVRLFARLGAHVAFNYNTNRDFAEKLIDEIKQTKGKHICQKCNVGEFSDVIAFVHKTAQTFGKIDVLVNNAGITTVSLLVNTSEQDFDDVLNTNLKGAFNFMRAVGRPMMKQKGGHIINIASYVGMKGKKGLSAYSSSKAGLIGLTKTGARELCRYSIMVNAVLPGYMLTDMWIDATEKAREIALRESIVKDFSDPFRAAEFICWLSGTKGITGQIFNLDSRIL